MEPPQKEHRRKRNSYGGPQVAYKFDEPKGMPGRFMEPEQIIRQGNLRQGKRETADQTCPESRERRHPYAKSAIKHDKQGQEIQHARDLDSKAQSGRQRQKHQ